MNEIGELIKRKRIEMEMTQQELAAKLGCQSQTVSGWETGRRNVNSAYFSQLSRILKINYQTLLDLSKGEDMDSNKFMDDYMSIETTTDAIHFLDEMLEDFDIDPAVKVSLMFKIRNYCLLVLLYSVSQKDQYTQPDNPYDIEVFLGELMDNVYNRLLPERYSELGYIAFEEHEYSNRLLVASGNIYDSIKGYISEDDDQLRIHVFEFANHVREKSYGEINQGYKYIWSYGILD